MRNYNIKHKVNKFIDSTQDTLKSYQVNICKRNRIKLTSDQLAALELCFWEDNHPNTKTKEDLAHALNIPFKNLQIWFQNRRAKRKNERDAMKLQHNKKISKNEQEWLNKFGSIYMDERYKSNYDQYANRQYYPHETNHNIYYENEEIHPEIYSCYHDNYKYNRYEGDKN